MIEVPRVRQPDVATLRQDLDLGRAPLIIEGALAGAAALKRWSVASLSRRLGHVRVRYKLSESGAHPDFHAPSLQRAFAQGESRFDEFLRSITEGGPRARARRLLTGDEHFLWRRRGGRAQRGGELATLLDDVAVPELVPDERLYGVWPWFSGRGVRTWLHYDNNGCHNLNAQIAGRKRCFLFRPDPLEAFQLFDPNGSNPAHNCSAIDVHAKPLEQLDALSSEAYQAELRPGDLLYVPAWWLHALEHLGEFNANVNFWWKPLSPMHGPLARRQAALQRQARPNERAKPAS